MQSIFNCLAEDWRRCGAVWLRGAVATAAAVAAALCTLAGCMQNLCAMAVDVTALRHAARRNGVAFSAWRRGNWAEGAGGARRCRQANPAHCKLRSKIVSFDSSSQAKSQMLASKQINQISKYIYIDIY